ncbi:branched-chain amino acid ABC transporter permease/ATP-binding protein [Frankia sp. AiPs1]|uniref:ABC transporter permease subunit n=1 Tax=Frankia sp. AiPs1 TaxID=573493 RepID=UPI0020436F81|nr:branched-chain amino acid ABC transporter permease/ATP-binding protein [Frankia sp. AiPs1]MCM3923087.1 branched-chain amino acid ABC transporter permease/ATP-binding protein [Frankia sp. AiPs1]
MVNHLNFVLLGLGNGAVFAALALALVVTYRSSGVLNFGTGALSLHAAYTYALLRDGKILVPVPGLPETIGLSGPVGLWPAIVITVLYEAVLGVLLYLLVFRPLRAHLAVAKAVASLGIMGLFTGIITMQVGGDQILVEPILPRHTWHAGGLRLLSDRFWFVAIIVLIAAALAAIYRFTRFGTATRAAAETEVGALVSGLSPDLLALANWAISAAVAGIAGILIAPLVPLVPGTYTLFIVPALAAAVLGRFSLLAPAVLGGIGIGALQSEAVYLQTRADWFPSSGVAELIPLVIVLAVLVIQGRPLPTRGMLLERTLGRAPRPHSAWKPAVVLVPLAVVAIYVANDSYRGALMETFIAGVLALSLVVVTGYVGQISLAQLTLAGAAGFLLSTVSHAWHIPFPISPILAALGAAAIGVLAGLPALRIRGMLVAVVTLTLAVALEAIWFRNNDLNGGTGGAPIANPSLFGLDLGIGTGKAFPRPEFGLLCLAVLAAVAIGVAHLRRSRLGSAMLAVRADERSAAAAGISVVRVKLLGFAIASFIAGLAGCLTAYKQTTVTFTSFSALLGLSVFTTVFLAGITSVSGGLLAGALGIGGVFYVFLSRTIDIGEWYGIVSGLGLIGVVIRSPDGIVGPAHLAAEKRRRRRLSTGPAAPAPAPTSAAAGAPPIAERRPAGARLSISGVGVTYGGVTALSDVTIDVAPGTIVGVIGPNGAGKTTMMDAACGFTAAAGEITLAGQRLDGLPPHRRARHGLARTFQGLDLYEDLTVEENLMAGQHAARPGAPSLDELLTSLGLWEERGRGVGELSQGQRQLVSIARALASGPRVLLLDEPAAGLDPTHSAWLAVRLRAVRDRGVTIVLVDHDMRFVLDLCDTIHVLDFGRQIADGPPPEIRANPKVAKAYLGSTHAAPSTHPATSNHPATSTHTATEMAS